MKFEELTQIVGQYPPEHQGRYLELARALESRGLITAARASKLTRRRAIIDAAKRLHKAGMISGVELWLIRIGLSVLCKLIGQVLFGDDT